MPIVSLQDEEEVRAHLANHTAMVEARTNWESTWRDVDARVDPQAQGSSFHRAITPGIELGLDNFDSTAIDGLDKFQAAILGLTVPTGQQWHGLTIANKDLAKLPQVKRWLEHARDRLFACRYASYAGFDMAMGQDVRQTGKYGTAPLWVDEVPGVGLFYKPVHLSEVYIKEDFRGRVDTVHREFEHDVRQLRQLFGEAALTDRMAQAWSDPNQRNKTFRILHVLCPNEEYEAGDPGPNGKRIRSVYIALDEKCILRRSGYATMPLLVSRNVLSPGSVYGRSPAMKVIGTIKTANEIAKTMLRAGHKAVDPALAFYDDGVINKLVTKPGGLNPGLMDDQGRMLVAPIPTGANIPLGEAMQERERKVIDNAFLGQLFEILTDPSDRMTATQVLEMVQKQGVLVRPFASQHETEKLAPMVARELDILLRAGQIAPMPPEMVEAGITQPSIVYQNPLARMARAEEASGLTRWVEIGLQIASATQDPSIFDYLDTDAAMPALGDVLSVPATWMRSPDEVAAIRAQRQEEKQLEQATAAAPALTLAAKNAAQANQIAAAA